MVSFIRDAILVGVQQRAAQPGGRPYLLRAAVFLVGDAVAVTIQRGAAGTEKRAGQFRAMVGLVGDAIASRWEFTDHQGDGIPNYLYNLDPDRLPVVIYEHPALSQAHVLPNMLGGLALAVEE